MGVQRGESSEVQKVGSNFEGTEFSAGPFQADLETTPMASLVSHSESQLGSRGWVQRICLSGHVLRGVQGPVRPTMTNLRHHGEWTVAISFPA